jgi:hypothetical protein
MTSMQNVTPYLDAFAKTGTRFQQAHVMHTQCSPSRCTMLTGRHVGFSFFFWQTFFVCKASGQPGASRCVLPVESGTSACCLPGLIFGYCIFIYFPTNVRLHTAHCIMADEVSLKCTSLLS